MSELKSYKLFHRASALTSPEFLSVVEFGNGDEVYDKDEANKVIAELKRQIEFLKVTANSCKNCSQCADGMGKVFDKEFNPLKDELRHQKYKRCLAMAERCKYRMCYLAAVVEQEASKIIPLKAQIQWYQKRENRMNYWKNRWLELAEQFKESK